MGCVIQFLCCHARGEAGHVCFLGLNLVYYTFLKEIALQQGKTRFGMFEDEVAELAEGDQKRLWDPVGCGW